MSAELGKDSDADGAIAVPDTSSPASPTAATPRVHGRRCIRPSSEVSAGSVVRGTGIDDDESDSSDSDDPDSFLCDAGPLLADVALVAGAHAACPFTANGIEVHCPGILGARRAADMHWKVAFYNNDAGFVRRDRLFAVVDLAAAWTSPGVILAAPRL